MNETIERSTCERENDLISFLYGETNEQEARDFERHLQLCNTCRIEMASLGEVRESIGLWKEEALFGFMSPQVELPERKKSALVALREFFDLSPLWMKGAVGFAAILFCVMVVLVGARIGSPANPPNLVSSAGKYTEQDLQQAVREALRKQAESFAANDVAKSPSESTQKHITNKNPTNGQSNRSTQWAKSRRPLSKSEQEQLAADLRLLSTRDEDGLNLIADRINQEF
jgi:hypothetical protein